VISEVWTPALGRKVHLREGTSDRQTWADVFTGLYHVPPSDMPAPTSVLDLGSNVGLTAAHYQTMWPDARIVAVEMDEGNAAMIARNAPSVTVLNAAVSAEGGWGAYNPDLPEEAFAFSWHGDTGRMVASYRLRQIIHRYIGEQGVDFVKMDVESEEWAIFDHDLTSARPWAPLVRHLLVELHGPGGSEALIEQAVSVLDALGFDARHHPPHPQAVYAERR